MVTRFPFEPQSNHPQYLWNEHEYIIRMLCQSVNKIGITESGTNVTVTRVSNESLNTVAQGAADYPAGILHETFATTTTRWIYISADGARTYSSNTRPQYNPFLHGFYTSTGDRAILFIDANMPTGQRAIVMDSFNSMFEFDNQWPVPDGGWGNWWLNITRARPPMAVPRTLPRGRYIFRLRGGQGGHGGTGGVGHPDRTAGVSGGRGGSAPIVTGALVLLEDTELFFFVGGDGLEGANGRGDHVATNNAIGGTNTARGQHRIVMNGGGGTSGEDTWVGFHGLGNTRLFESIGGAGGGGGALINGSFWQQHTPPVRTGFLQTSSPAGGGGAGTGSGWGESEGVPQPTQNGFWASHTHTGTQMEAFGGLLFEGGRGSFGATANFDVNNPNAHLNNTAGTVAGTRGHNLNTDNSQSVNNLLVRNPWRFGGNSPQMWWNHNIQSGTVAAVRGNWGVTQHAVNAYIRIWRFPL